MHEIVARALGKEFCLEVRREPLDIEGIKRFSLVSPEGIVLRRPAELFGWLRSKNPVTIGQVSDGFHTFDELYEHRHALVLTLMRCRTRQYACMSRLHADGTAFEGYFIVGIELPYLQLESLEWLTHMVTYHLPDRLWDAAVATNALVLDRMHEWDGHTSEDVVRRLLAFATKTQ